MDHRFDREFYRSGVAARPAGRTVRHQPYVRTGALARVGCRPAGKA